MHDVAHTHIPDLAATDKDIVHVRHASVLGGANVSVQGACCANTHLGSGCHVAQLAVEVVLCLVQFTPERFSCLDLNLRGGGSVLLP